MIENKKTSYTGDYLLDNFPKGIAILSYQDSYNANSTIYSGQIVLKNVESPIEFNKGQRLGKMEVIGRNSPVLQSMGGKGLIYPEVKFMLKDENQYEIIDSVAHQSILAIAGWCDAGVPLFFMFDKWRRRVVIDSLKFEMMKYHTWYECVMILEKYVPIEPLAYQRKLVDLAPYPELPVPTNPGSGSTTKKTGQGRGEVDITDPSNKPADDGDWRYWEWTEYADGTTGKVGAQIVDGEIDCLPHIITEDDIAVGITSLLAKYYAYDDFNDLGTIGPMVRRIVQERNGFNLVSLFTGEITLDSIPAHKRIICLPKKVKIVKGSTEKIINIRENPL
jgi:hypothetical protein